MSEAADAVVRRLRAEWARANAVLTSAVLTSARDKTRLPDGYWQEEHDARLRLEMAEEIAAALEDVE